MKKLDIFCFFAWILQSNSIHDKLESPDVISVASNKTMGSNFHQVMDPLAPTLLETCTMALVGCFVLLPPKKGGVLSEERPFCVLWLWIFIANTFFLLLFILQMFLFPKSTFRNVIHDTFRMLKEHFQTDIPFIRTGATARWWTDLGFLEAMLAPNLGDRWS